MHAEHLNIKSQVEALPDKPGIYQYFDEKKHILYVGKAKSLRKRVASYFSKNHDNAKVRLLVKKIRTIEYIVTDSEFDALLLENNLIKKYQPLYNIQLKDDKTFPWICIKKERFPRIFSTRKVLKDGSKYFGPFASVKMMNTLISLIRQIYFIRTCNYDLSEEKINAGKYKECLEYHIGNCKAPCVGKQTSDNYDAQIQDIEQIIKGNIGVVAKKLKLAMKTYAESFEFEEAQKIKDKIDLLANYQSRSVIVSPTIEQIDVITMVEDTRSAYVNYLKVNKGAVVQGQTIEIKKVMDESFQDIIPFVLMEMRERFQSKAKEVIVEQVPDYAMSDFNYFRPQRGDKKHLVDMSLKNAKAYMIEKHKQEKLKDPDKHARRILEVVKKDLRLSELPEHIECFDNSNFQGTNPVAACVVFKNAKPSKKDYRHFNIKTVVGPDDFASMTEVVERRYKRLIDENASLPQLIVIDGGKGQLSAALKALKSLGLEGQIAIIGIAKRLEEIYFPNDSIPLYLDKRSESLKLIQNLRNEAHRFGITHHRNRRSAALLKSELVDIKGIGEQTASLLLKHFRTVENIKNAAPEDLQKIVGSAKSKIIQKWFSQNN